jgi:hypothetical protein
MNMRNHCLLWTTAIFLASACEIHEGSFDGSFFEDSSTRDDDGGVGDEEDSGKPSKDAGKSGAGGKSGSGGSKAGSGGAGGDEAKDAGMDAEIPPEPTLTPSDVGSVFSKGQCAALETCLGERLLLDSLQGNDCVDFMTRQKADQQLHWLMKSVSADHVTFRPEKLEQCQKDIEKQGCEVRSRRLPASCEDAIEGKVDVDGDCSIDADCKGNAWCDKGMLESCPGACAAPQTEGLPCTDSQQCADGLVCRSGNCSPPLSEGDQCNTSTLRCPPGLTCRSSMCQSISMVYTAELGATCNAVGQLCKLGLVCQSDDPNATTGKCMQPAAKGGACRPSQPGQCPIDQYCKNKSSAVTTPASPGTDGVCADRPGDGKACITGEDCAPGTACVGMPATCRSIKTAGGVCASDSNAECYGGACEQGTCAVTTIDCDG